jgi:adenosine kinase
MDILLTGSVAYDYLMTFPGHFKDHILPERLEAISLSFLVDSLARRRGGIAPNIAYNLALLGGKPRVFATVGEDFADYRDWLESKGVDTSLMKVVEGTYTASFFVTTDLDNAQMASFYPGAMAQAAELSLKDLDKLPDLVVISPNDPAAMTKLIAECKELKQPYLFDPSQQIVRVDGEWLRNGLEGAQSLFVNDYEFSLVQKMTRFNQQDIIKLVDFLVVTLGENGADIYQGDQKVHVNAVPPKQIIDPTGAGDAFRGGFLTGFSRGWDWQVCGQIGALSATYCLESDGPQGQDYTRQEFVARYLQHYQDDHLVEELLAD